MFAKLDIDDPSELKDRLTHLARKKKAEAASQANKATSSKKTTRQSATKQNDAAITPNDFECLEELFWHVFSHLSAVDIDYDSEQMTNMHVPL